MGNGWPPAGDRDEAGPSRPLTHHASRITFPALLLPQLRVPVQDVLVPVTGAAGAHVEERGAARVDRTKFLIRNHFVA